MSTPWSWSRGSGRQADEVRWSWKVTEMGQGTDKDKKGKKGGCTMTHERTWLIQHQSDRGSRSVSTDSRVSTASSSASCPAASAAATHASASLAAPDFLQHSHVPTGLPLGDFSHRMSHMVPCSFKTAFIPFALPHRSGLGSLSAYTMSCT